LPGMHQEAEQFLRRDGRAAKEAASTQVISTPSTMRRITTLRVWPLSFPHVEAQARVVEDDGHRQGYQRLEGRPEQVLRVDVASPCTGGETVGSNTMIAGMRGRFARTWDPAASARTRPTPIRIWFVVTPTSGNAEPVINLPTVHLPVARASVWAEMNSRSSDVCHSRKWMRPTR
jgi:hypothetical protein